jgi:hypothetical protein
MLARAAESATAFVFLLLLAFFTQRWIDAYRGEFEGDADGHYASGMVLHDYFLSLLHGARRSPADYVIWFHSHYPIVGIGHWPPLYYFVEAGWMLLFSISRTSILMLSAVVTACTALLIWLGLRRRFGAAVAYIAAAIFIFMPVVQQATGELMLDVPVALAELAAAMAFAKYLETEKARWSLLFGLLAAAAILTKGNGAALALVPPIALLLCRRFELLRRVSFWIPVPVVAVLTGPWYLLTYSQVEPGFRYRWGVEYVQVALAANTRAMLLSAGPVLVAAAIIGLIAATVNRIKNDSILTSNAALLCGVWLFQSIVPAAIQARYLIPLLPPLVTLAVYGASWVGLFVGRQFTRGQALPGSRTVVLHNRAALVAVAVVFATALPMAGDARALQPAGFAAPATEIWRLHLTSNPAVLIALPADAEGPAVAALAQDDPHRPSLFAVRGSRLLGGGGYNNQDYVPLYQTESEVRDAIDRFAIPLVLLGTRYQPDEWKHLQQIEALAAHSPDRWKLVNSWQAGDLHLALYWVEGNTSRIADTASLVQLSGPHHLVELGK